ncbi:MAG: ABC transporter permease [Myxococcota bacterium]
MRRRLASIYWLGRKELVSLRRDPVLAFFVVYAFTYAVYVPSATTGLEVRHASVAFLDEDRSNLSARLRDAVRTPYFRTPQEVSSSDIDPEMDAGTYTFVIDVPPRIEADLLAGRPPSLQILVDATAMSQAGVGVGYLTRMLGDEIEEFVTGTRGPKPTPILSTIRVAFNPNLEQSWYMGIVQLINNVTMLAILLTGAALLREREHETIEHLLVMPLAPLEIALAKVWANGLVIVVGAAASLGAVVHYGLGAPIRGSIPLFLLGTVTYLFSMSAVGIFLSTLVRSMPQFGLLLVPVIIPMISLSGGITPLESMPAALQVLMQALPTAHFVSFTTAVVYRGAGIDVVWESFAAIAAIGAVFFFAALFRFRASVAVAR